MKNSENWKGRDNRRDNKVQGTNSAKGFEWMHFMAFPCTICFSSFGCFTKLFGRHQQPNKHILMAFKRTKEYVHTQTLARKQLCFLAFKLIFFYFFNCFKSIVLTKSTGKNHGSRSKRQCKGRCP